MKDVKCSTSIMGNSSASCSFTLAWHICRCLRRVLEY